MIRAVFLDVGETIVDETHAWGQWADWLGIPRLTFFAVLGQVIERGEDHREVFRVLAPGLDLAAETVRKEAAGLTGRPRAEDLYPDALPCLAALRASGRRVGLAGNQPEATESALRDLGVTVDVIASSGRWGVAKPSPAFFARVIAEAGCRPAEVVYVGDRVDNDIVPAAAAGLRAVLLRRGPWAATQQTWPEAVRAEVTIDGLDRLPAVVAALDRAERQ